MFTIWIIIALSTLFIDVFTSSILFVWFSIGSIFSLIALSFGLGSTPQIIIFIVTSLIGLVLGYPLAKKFNKRSSEKVKTMEQSYIGREFTAEEVIKLKSNIKINGVYWTVVNKGGVIEKGNRFIIVGIEGNKLIIKNLKEIN